MNASAVCQFFQDRSTHIGETITFHGAYLTDHVDRALILPTGCKRGIGLGKMSPAANKLLEAADPPPWPFTRKIEAIVTAIIFQIPPNNSTFKGDDGVRLDVTAVTEIRVTERTPPR
jgi:hypothetical protein